MRHASAVALFALAALFACKAEDGAETKQILRNDTIDFDRSSEQILSVAAAKGDPAMADAVKDACNAKTLVVLIGNGETMGSLETWSLVPEGEKALTALLTDTGLWDNLRTAKKGLLSSPDGGVLDCPSASTGELLFLTVLDGPGMRDSEIATRLFSLNEGKWSGNPQINWHYDGAGLASGAGSFELNMAEAVSPIVNKIARLAPGPGAASGTFGASVHFTQIIYMIKSHGGRVSVSPDPSPTLATLPCSLADTASLRHVLLFDTHGEQGELRSGIYAPFWNKPTEAVAAAPCPAVGAGATAGISNDVKGTSGVQGGTAGVANGAGGTAGVQGGTAGVANGASGTAGVANGASGTAGVANGASGTAGVANGAGGTAGVYGGTSGIDGGTAGIDGGTAGVYGGTSGTGKGTMFLGNAADLRQASWANGPAAALAMGVAATYDADGVQGLSRLDLPVGTAVNAPTLVILDSCYGSDAILNALSGGKSRQVVIVTNSNPLYYQLIDYAALDATELVALPYVLARGTGNAYPKFHAEYADLAKQLVDHLAEGVDRQTAEQTTQAYAQLSVDVYNAGVKAASSAK